MKGLQMVVAICNWFTSNNVGLGVLHPRKLRSNLTPVWDAELVSQEVTLKQKSPEDTLTSERLSVVLGVLLKLFRELIMSWLAVYPHFSSFAEV